MSAELPQRLLQRLTEQGIKLGKKGGNLTINAPKGSMTEQLRSEILNHKSALLSLLSTPAQQTTPLSFAQQGFWLLDQLGGQQACTLCANMAIQGPLRVDALKASFAMIIARHDILRTAFGLQDHQPYQWLQSPVELPFTYVDASDDADAPLMQASLAFGPRQFALDKAPLCHLTLIKLKDQHWRLSFCIHHIIADDRSVKLFFDELAQHYAGTQPLAPLPLQYADFAHWQRQSAQGDAFTASLNWWLQKLQAPLPVFNLPFMAARHKRHGFEGARQECLMDAALAAIIDNFARQHKATRFMLLLAVFALLLYRYAGQSDQCIGTAVSTRSSDQWQSAIGCFVNFMILRSHIDPQMDFNQLLSA